MSARAARGYGMVAAVVHTVWMEGTSRVRVQHSAALGFLTPVAAGGALILAAGILVMLRGQEDLESEPPV